MSSSSARCPPGSGIAASSPGTTHENPGSGAIADTDSVGEYSGFDSTVDGPAPLPQPMTIATAKAYSEQTGAVLMYLTLHQLGRSLKLVR